MHTGGMAHCREDKAGPEYFGRDFGATSIGMFSAGLGSPVSWALWAAGLLRCGWGMARAGRCSRVLGRV